MSRSQADTAVPPVLRFVARERRDVQARREWGRQAILSGWAITMVGVIGYCFAMTGAGQETGILEALMRRGALGWGSAILLLGGVVVWLAGNIAYLREAMELPPADTGEDD